MIIWNNPPPCSCRTARLAYTAASVSSSLGSLCSSLSSSSSSSFSSSSLTTQIINKLPKSIIEYHSPSESSSSLVSVILMSINLFTSWSITRSMKSLRPLCISVPAHFNPSGWLESLNMTSGSLWSPLISWLMQEKFTPARLRSSFCIWRNSRAQRFGGLVEQLASDSTKNTLWKLMTRNVAD